MDLIFGDYRLRLHERELIGPAGAMELSAPAFELLRAFLAQPQTLLDKDALFAAAWPGTIVEDNTLQVHISALRKALGPGLIATVHGRGYRYTGPPPREAEEPIASASRQSGNIDRYRSDCIAREAEAAAIAALLEKHRLVSVVGPGGVGKTTLAVSVADQLPRPSGGTWMIDLASVGSGAFVESTLIQTLNVPFRAGSDWLRTMAGHLQGADTLLVFDNCEHVQSDAARIAGALLRELPGLRILVTTQVPLGLAEERVFKLAPFAVTESGGGSSPSERFLAYCIERFGDAMADADRPAAVRLSQRLDGVALALKMAAARAASIGLETVDRQLEAQLAGLAADWNTALPRHRSLTASLAWSYDLLAPDDQRLLRLLGVFHGSFSLPAVAAVAGPAAEPRVAELVRRSLVVRDGVDRGRYRLLDSTRSFALARLAEAGEEHDARDRHAAHITALFAQSVERWEDTPDEDWKATYRADGDNLRAALGWTKSRPQSAGYVELAAQTARYFIEEQLGSEGLATIEAGAPLLRAASAEAAAQFGLALGEICRFNAMDIRARQALLPALDWLRGGSDRVRYGQALALLTLVTLFFRPREEALPLLEELRRVIVAMPVCKTKSWALVSIGLHMWMNGETEAGLARCRAGFAMHVETGNPGGRFRSVMNVTEILHAGGATPLAVELSEEVMPDLRARGSRLQLANQLGNLAAYLYWLGDVEGARAAHNECAALMPRDGSYWHICLLQNDAEQLYWMGDQVSAALLLGIIDRRIRDWPDGRQTTEQMQRDRLEQRLAESLGDGELRRLLAQGNGLDLVDAETIALKVATPGASLDNEARRR